jgi:hypothetical protein
MLVMSDWMAMTAADLTPHEAWQQYRKATGMPEQATVGGYTWNLFTLFLAGAEYGEAQR